MSIIGKRIRAVRTEKEMRREDLAAKSGVSYEYISGIERGKHTNVGLETLERLAKALGVAVADLIQMKKAS